MASGKTSHKLFNTGRIKSLARVISVTVVLNIAATVGFTRPAMSFRELIVLMRRVSLRSIRSVNSLKNSSNVIPKIAKITKKENRGNFKMMN